MTEFSDSNSQRHESAPEVKSADISDAFAEFMSSFESFKDANDQRLAELETRMGADVLTTEKVERISRGLDEQKRALDQLNLKRQRPQLGRDTGPAPDERKAAFDAYMRSGDERSLRALDEKAMSIGAGQDGGYLVPAETEAEIGKRLEAMSPIRALATVRQVSSAVFKKPFLLSGPSAGWVAETAPRPETAAAQLQELTFPTMELYAQPAATQALLDDAVVNLDEWISAEVEAAFARQEGAAFVNGDGVTQPAGFLSADKVPDAEWAWKKIGYVTTGVDGAFPAANADPSGADRLVELAYALKSDYRKNATWVMNRRTQGAVRRMKDANGAYLWLPPSQAGGSASLLGFPVAECEDMPDIAAGAFPIAFGDFARGYLVVDRIGVRVLRDPYMSKPYVLFYTTKRVGGGVQDYDAIKLMKFGTV